MKPMDYTILCIYYTAYIPFSVSLGWVTGREWSAKTLCYSSLKHLEWVWSLINSLVHIAFCNMTVRRLSLVTTSLVRSRKLLYVKPG